MERVENYARFISVNFNLALEQPGDFEEQWEPLIITTGDDKNFYSYYDTPSRESVIHFMTFDQRNPNSIQSMLFNIRENARTVRESITKEMWEHINKMYMDIQRASKAENRVLNRLQDFFNDIKMGCQLFFGIVDASMTRSEGWHFSNMGRHLERADKTARIVDVKYFILLPAVNQVGSPLDIMQWSAVLKSASAYNMYRQHYKVISPANITEFLLLDRHFPRSVLYCLRNAENSLREISGTSAGSFSNTAEKKLGQLRSKMEFTDVADILKQGLHEYLDTIQTRCNEISGEIHDAFFTMKPIHLQDSKMITQ